MTIYCTHYDCRAKAAADLHYLAERLHRPSLARRATRVLEQHEVEVPCRRDDARPRPALPRGPANTHIPLPPERDAQEKHE